MQYLIRATDEKDDEGYPLFWSNIDGWVLYADATRFSADEMDKFHLPLGGEWVLTTEDNVPVDALQAHIDAGEAEGEYVGEHTEDISWKFED